MQAEASGGLKAAGSTGRSLAPARRGQGDTRAFTADSTAPVVRRAGKGRTVMMIMNVVGGQDLNL
jgi:hypothetical protein